MKKPIVFMFSGQGSHYYHMGRELYEHNPTFKHHMQVAESIYRDITGLSILDNLYNDYYKKSDPFTRTLLTHPSIFMVEHALTCVLLEQGISPDYVLGTSLGEFSAAVCTGILNFEEAFQAVIAQAQMLESHCSAGAMMAIFQPYSFYNKSPFIHQKSESAAIHFPSHFVIAGKSDNLKQIAIVLKEQQIIYQDLAVMHGFHSSLIDDAAHPYLHFINQYSLKVPDLPFISCVHENHLAPLSPKHFWDAIRQPIQFQEILEKLEKENNFTYLDLSPSGTLATSAKYNLKETSSSQIYALLTPFGSDVQNLIRVSLDLAL